MNLIEQLGGYRMAKEVMDSIPKDGRSYTITRDDTGIIFNTSELHNALLEHRRQHNIFEIDDLITHPMFWGVFKIKEVLSHHVVAITKTEYESKLAIALIKHATIPEIAAGRRL